MKNSTIVTILLLAFNSANCQSANQSNALSSWDKISWLTGDWVGDGFGGVSYETWTEPIEDIMLGVFRHVSDGQNNFFELISISKKEDGQLVMKLRHFNPDMNAWEDKEGQLVWELKGLSKNSVTFGPCTYKLVDPDKMEISLIMNNDGQIETEVFNFVRKK